MQERARRVQERAVARRSFGRKGSYFFVLDAFIAGLIIISSVTVMLNAFAEQDSPSQSFMLAQDFASLLSDTLIDEYVGEAIYNMTRDGAIQDKDLTLLQLVVQLYHQHTALPPTCMTCTAPGNNLTLLLEEVSSLAPIGTGVAYSIDDDGATVPLYNVSAGALPRESRIMLSAHRVVSFMDDEELIGPYVVEVRLWR